MWDALLVYVSRVLRSSRIARQALVLALLGSLTLGCRANWIVVRQAEPNPLKGRSSFVVAPVVFQDLGVDPSHQEVIRNAYNYELRREGQDRYRFVLPEDAGPEDVTIETTFYRVDVSSSEVRIRVRLLQKAEVIDEFRLHSDFSYSIFHGNGSRASLGYTSESQRLDECGEELGENVAQYIKTRT